MTKKIPKCETKNNISAEYCFKCGYHFTDDNPHYKPIQLKALKCPQCHHTIENLSYGFCTKCGYEFREQKDNITINYLEVIPQLEYERTIRAGYLLAVLIPIVGLCLGIYNFTRKDSPDARHAGKIQILISLVFLMMDIMYISIIFNRKLF